MIRRAFAIAVLGLCISLLTTPSARGDSGPYCGVYCVYSALSSFDRAPEFEKLLEPRYVESHYGSSLAALKRAVTDFGGHAEAFEQLTVSALRNSPCPVILHVRRPGLNTTFAHWVLFLGVEDGQARIVDPPHAVRTMPFGELLSLWDGTGLAVSDVPISPTRHKLAAWLEQGLTLGSLAAIVFALKLLAGDAGRWRLRRVGLVLGAAGLTAAVLHLGRDDGFARCPTGVAQTVGLHFRPDIPEIGRAEVATLVGKPGVRLIDARYPGDYRAGHIPGAASLPVFSGVAERSAFLADLDPADRVVVYCQSEGCRWGDSIAADLYHRGFTRVAVYRGGWMDWSEQPK